MKITLSTSPLAELKTDLVAIGVREGQLGKNALVRTLDRALGGALSRIASEEDFQGRFGEALIVPALGRIGASRVLLVGLGNGADGTTATNSSTKRGKGGRGASASDTAAGPNGIRDTRLVAVKAASLGSKLGSVAVVPSTAGTDGVRAAAEGLRMGAYRYTRYLTGDRRPKSQLREGIVVVEGKTNAALQRAVDDGSAVGELVNVTRDLVNAPPNDMTPAALADAAADLASKARITCRVFDKKKIQELGMHLLLAVNRGSSLEPRFVHMSYKPKKVRKAPRVVFVGKGLTFDSGGLCIKPAKSMLDMKCDMAGGAVTIAVVAAAAHLGLPIEVHGVVAATENMSGPDAYRPGDVFPSLDGKSVEIINTDAEGRLILADALAYARKLEPDYLVDHATLTGACMVALGQWTAGLFSNDDALAKRYASAAAQAGESFWTMPLLEDLREGLKSDIADLKHTGEPHGGAVTAALFLREFVGDSRWIHLDIAGPAFTERPRGIHPKGGTGFGVLTGIRFLELLSR